MDGKYLNNRVIIIFALLLGSIFIVMSFVYSPKEKKLMQQRRYGGIYRYAHSENIVTLDPRKAVFVIAQNSVLLIFDPLIKVSDDMRLAPSVCASWDINDDGYSFYCHIRPGILFHDGQELTSEDVVFSLNYIARKMHGMNLETSSLSLIKGMTDYWSGMANTIVGIHSVDRYTVRIDLDQACPHFAYIISSPRFVVFPAYFRGEDVDRFFQRPVGTGPFRFVDMQDNTLSVEAYADYYDGRPYLDTLEMKYYLNKEDAIKAFVNGDADDISYYYITEIPSELNNSEHILKDSYTNLIVFPNNSRPPFNDQRYRKLLYDAIDREGLVSRCFSASRTSHTIIPKGIIGYNQDALKKTYDIQSAKKGIADLESDGRNIQSVTIYALEADLGRCAADYINNNFRALNIPWHVELTNTDVLSKTFFDGSMQADIELIGVKNEDAFSILRFFSGDESENLARIHDSVIDEALKKARYESDPLKRVVIYREIDARIVEMEYVMPIVSPRIYGVWNNKYQHTDLRTTRLVHDFTLISLK